MFLRVLATGLIGFFLASEALSGQQPPTLNCLGSGAYTVSFQELAGNKVICGAVLYSGFALDNGGLATITASNTYATFFDTSLGTALPPAMLAFSLLQPYYGSQPITIPAGQTYKVNIAYHVAATSDFKTGSLLSNTWPNAGPGSVTITSHKCAGGNWISGLCDGSSISPTITQTRDSKTYVVPSTFVNVSTDIVLAAGVTSFSVYAAFLDSNGVTSINLSPPSIADLVIAGVRNAASGATGPIVPGEIISIFPNPSSKPIGPTTGVGLQLDQNGKVATSLGGVQVHFLPIDVYAPLTFVNSGQINAAVPYELAGLTNVKMQIQYLGQASDPFDLQVASSAPGIFTPNGTGTGQGAILNHDGTVNGPTQPEPRGGVVVLYLTGEGQTVPAGVSGKVTTVSPTPPLTPTPMALVAVLINGQAASVAFAGQAPGLISGVLQLNVQIPTTISPGTVPIQVSVGGISTPNTVTVSVQ